LFERLGTKIHPAQLNSHSQAADAGNGEFSSMAIDSSEQGTSAVLTCLLQLTRMYIFFTALSWAKIEFISFLNINLAAFENNSCIAAKLWNNRIVRTKLLFVTKK